MEQELDEEYLAELLKEPKNVIFDTLADHLLGNVHSECCELLLLNMEKCRLYVDCIRGFFLFPSLVPQEDEGASVLEVYKDLLLLMTSVLFGEFSMVTHLKEIDNDGQHRLSAFDERLIF